MDLGITKKYMIFNLVTNTTKDNRPFIRMTLTDTDGGSMNAIMFDSNKLSFEPARGQVVNVTGALQQYNGVTQLKVSDMVLLEGEDANEFLPKSDKDAKAMKDELKAVLKVLILKAFAMLFMQIRQHILFLKNLLLLKVFIMLIFMAY